MQGPHALAGKSLSHNKCGAVFGYVLEKCSVTSSAGKRLVTYSSMAACSATSSAVATSPAAATSVVLR